MQDLDLNINLNYFQKLKDDEVVKAICTCFNNEYTSPATFNHLKELNIEYDFSSQTLKITNKRWSVIATNFVLSSYFNKNNNKFLSALIHLMVNNYHLEIRSKFGKFTPYINQKQGLQTPFSTVHVQVENAEIDSTNSTNLKDVFNEDKIKCDDWTVVTISPINEKLVEDLKNHLSWTSEWKEILHSYDDYLLINKSRKFNVIYLNGCELNFYREWTPKLLYSYDIGSSFMDNVNEYHDDDWYTERALWLILEGLSDDDKKKIYPTILNNKKCLEWSYPKIQKLIIRFLNEQDPNQYVIYNEDLPMPNEQIELVKQANKIVIKLDEDVYNEIKDEVPNIYKCFQQILIDKFCNHQVNDDELSSSEKNNVKLLKEFLIYFTNHYEPLRKELAKDDLDTLPIIIVSGYPNGTGAFSFFENKVIIDRSNLHDLGQTLVTLLRIIWVGFSTDNYHEFKNIWLKNAVDFLTKSIANNNNKNNK